MSFLEISSKIIKEAINSAVYIDDKVWLPFEERSDELIDQSALFYSFKKNNCYVDFNRYLKDDNTDYSSILNNKDLLILDWHLSSDESNLSDTFDILKLAINTHCLHFSVIYTDQKKEILPEKVVLNIASYFSGLNKDIAVNGLQKYKGLIDSTGLDEAEQQNFTNELSRLGKELFFEIRNKERNKELSRELNNHILTQFKRRDFEEFLNELNLPEPLFKEKLICLSFILNECDVPDISEKHKILVYPDRYTIRVKSLYIKVLSKQTVNETELYSEFNSSITTGSNIFLTLLGLELRNRFRESSGFIGKELDDLNQLAFFHHRKSHFGEHEDLFNEFLKDIWKDQVSSFLMEKDIELFKAINEFKDENDIETKLTEFKKDNPNSRNDLAKLNFVYNRLAIKRKENDEIRFGDIFLLTLNNNASVYLLCLTQQCDCLRPNKIKNMFFFVEGENIGITRGVEKSDGDFISFLEDIDKNPICVDWTNGTDDCKPFTFHITNNQMQGEKKTITVNYQGENKEISYICTLKENYAQRISNKAFSYPLRVGIDFATFKTNT